MKEIYVRANGPATIVPQHRIFGPRQADDDEWEDPCPACGLRFRAGDYTTLVVLGPGPDAESQQKCRDRRYYNARAIEVHRACATGEA